MLSYLLRRLLHMLIVVVIVSIVSFIVIQLPPGDFVTTYMQNMQMSGTKVEDAELAAMRNIYGLDRPLYIQYVKWAARLVQGDMGVSLQWNRPVSELIRERLPLTIVVSVAALIFSYMVSIPIGIYSATHQYSIGDYTATVLGMAGMAIPGFLLALILMFVFYKYFGISAGGLFSAEQAAAPWSTAKLIDLLKHLPVPTIVVGTSGTAYLVRVMRGCLLDEMRKQYVITARAKGVTRWTLLFRYPVRVAINPIISTIGWTLPSIVSGGTIVSIVLGLPTLGPLLIASLTSEDMYLTGSIVMVLSILTIVGTFISDLLLVAVDPRIRLEKEQGT